MHHIFLKQWFVEEYKNSRKRSVEEIKNSPNWLSKNKTIPQTVRQGINNFHKPSVASIANISECLKMFIFIIHPSSNIRRYEPSYRWKYGFKLFETCLYIISKNSQGCWKSDDPSSICRRKFYTLLSDIWQLILHVSSQIWHMAIANSTNIRHITDDIVLQRVVKKHMLRTSKIWHW